MSQITVTKAPGSRHSAPPALPELPTLKHLQVHVSENDMSPAEFGSTTLFKGKNNIFIFFLYPDIEESGEEKTVP